MVVIKHDFLHCNNYVHKEYYNENDKEYLTYVCDWFVPQMKIIFSTLLVTILNSYHCTVYPVSILDWYAFLRAAFHTV